jgi:hypothetical protein
MKEEIYYAYYFTSHILVYAVHRINVASVPVVVREE